MTDNEKQSPGRGQLNLNTILLSASLMVSGWALKSIVDMQDQLSGLLPIVSANQSAIQGINNVNKEQSDKIDDLSTRLTKLETKDADGKRN